MKNNIQLSIPKPCSENWEAMQAQNHGRFCSSCRKTVTDFTNMKDDAFIAYFQNKRNVGCGRFTERQLQLEIPFKSQPLIPFSRISKYIAASMITTAGLSGKVLGQDITTTEITSIATIDNGNETKISDKTTVVKGRVIDYQGNGEPNLSILIKDYNISTFSDAEGYFELQIIKDPKIVFYELQIFTADKILWETHTFNIYTHPPVTVIKLPHEITVHLTTGGITSYRPTIWNRFKRWIKTNFL